MVYVTAPFALLAAVASLAAVSSVDAAVISDRHSSSVAHGSQKDSPVLPLPARIAKGKGASKAKHDSKKAGKHDVKGGKAHEARIVQLDDDVLGLPIKIQAKRAADQAFFTSRAPHDKVVLNGDDDHVHIHDNHRHHDDDRAKVIVNGDDEHVHIHRRRRHHHHNDWHDSSKVIVNGDHDHVNVHERRLSPKVLVHNKHGQSFIVSRSHRAIARRSTETLERRVDENAPSGTISLMLTNDAGAQKKLGSLYMNTAKNPVELDASETNATTTYMVADNTMDASQDRNIKYVRLHYLVTDSRELAVVAWCATYDSTPDEPAPMTVVPCRNDSTNARQSQTFIYYIDTNVIAPMSATSNSTSEEDDDTEDASDIVDGGVTEGATSLQEREPAQNVTLVFAPNGPEEEDMESAEDESATYTTITETRTVTVTASSTPSAMADDEEDSASSTMTSNSVQSTLTSSDSSATPSSTSINRLDVKVYGASSDSSSEATESTSSSSTAAVPSSTDTASSSSTDASSSSTDAASPSVDAEAVASDIANPSSNAMTKSSEPSPSVASVASRAEMTAVDTAPYMWKFTREMRW